MEASPHALVYGLRRTRETLAGWRERPGPVLRSWSRGSLGAAALLLSAVWLVSITLRAPATSGLDRVPPLFAGGPDDVRRILQHNLLVLALHAMACVAGFIAGSSLPLQARRYTGLTRVIHERGPWLALGFVFCATGFSLSMQAYTIGTGVAQVASVLHVSSALLVLGLLPHAVPELGALFLPLAAWIVASRRGDWDQLLAATFVTTALAVPVLVAAALWEVYVAPHLLGAMFAYG
jgi:hypothetical protein